MPVLSDIFGIIMYHVSNSPCHVNNKVDGLNNTDQNYLKKNGTCW